MPRLKKHSPNKSFSKNIDPAQVDLLLARGLALKKEMQQIQKELRALKRLLVAKKDAEQLGTISKRLTQIT